MKQRKSCFLWFILVLMVLTLILSIIAIPKIVELEYGKPSVQISLGTRFRIAMALLANSKELTTAAQPGGAAQIFEINKGETVNEISLRLQQVGLISNADAFRAYLIWKGLDTSVQAGKYELNPGMTALQLAKILQDATPAEVEFIVLPGWRMEEIAGSLPTSGLKITPEEFMRAVRNPEVSVPFLSKGFSVEGLLFPGSYQIPRDTKPQELVTILVQNCLLYLSTDLQEALNRQGLDYYQGITLASIVQREAVVVEEQPMIASVFINRLRKSMKLDSDPTVQYALGFYQAQNTWWKNPLNSEDLKIESPYNTYLNPGLPPTPISNPPLSAIMAVAYPATTDYLYFRAKCDGSNLHAFALTYEEHLQNACK